MADDYIEEVLCVELLALRIRSDASFNQFIFLEKGVVEYLGRIVIQFADNAR